MLLRSAHLMPTTKALVPCKLGASLSLGTSGHGGHHAAEVISFLAAEAIVLGFVDVGW